MANYFYDHSVEDRITIDKVGCVCRNDETAIAAGRIQLASLLSLSKSKLPWQHFELIIRREDGVHVGRISMTVVTETQNPVSAAALPYKANGHTN